jgi:hypothetical protein
MVPGKSLALLFVVLTDAGAFSKVDGINRIGMRFSSHSGQSYVSEETSKRFCGKTSSGFLKSGENSPRSSSRLFMVDADTVSAVGEQVSQAGSDTINVAISTFFASVSSRIVGIVIGNILAAAFVKYVTDFFKNGVANIGNKGANDAKTGSEKGQGIVRSADKNDTFDGIPPEAFFKLALCVAIDLLGDSSFLIPGVGEVEDVAWAPMSAYAMKFMFGSNALAGLDFVKEILPATDIIPLATLAWILTYVTPQNPISDALGLKKDLTKSNNKNDESVIDV